MRSAPLNTVARATRRELEKHGGPEMKRIHIGLEVKDLESSINFYSALFGAQPTHRETDYAKWMLEDPWVNFAIQSREDEPAGSLHFGIQVENTDELAEYADRLENAGQEVVPEPDAACCYYIADKIWVADPDAVRWETFLTTGRHAEYGENLGIRLESTAGKEAAQ